MPPTKFDLLEAPLVMRLFELIGLPYRDLSDPKVKYGRETGADVEVHHDDRCIGIQVTEFHADEGLGHAEQGLRATEARNEAEGKYTASYLPIQHQLPSLTARVGDKIAKARRYKFGEFKEVWLVVAAALPRPDALVSTFLLPMAVTVDSLNREMHDALRESKYARAFIFSVVGATVYEWSKTSGWRLLHASEPPQVQTEHVEPNWLVGCLQNGALHDAGLRWFVTEGPKESMRIIAYTFTREDAQKIAAALEATRQSQ